MSVSVALSLAGFGSMMPMGGATVAVLTRVPKAVLRQRAGGGVGRRVADGQGDAVVMLPAPDGLCSSLPLAVQVQVQPVSAAGKVSVTVAPVAVLGPAALTGGDRVGHRGPRDHGGDPVGLGDGEIGGRVEHRDVAVGGSAPPPGPR